MGLFWSMLTLNSDVPGRMLEQPISKPYHTTVSLYRGGFLNISNMQWSHDPEGAAVKCQLTRRYLHPDVARYEVNVDGIIGTLFLPPGDGPFPTVIDIFGIASIIESRAALLASHGFASFALAYTNFKGLPKIENRLDFNYFLKAFDWLESQPFVKPGGLGGVALCSGAGYLSLIASFRRQLKWMVLINSAWFPLGKTQKVEGETIKSMMFMIERLHQIDTKYLSMKELWLPFDDISVSKGWQNGAKILYLNGEDDQCVNPRYSTMFQRKIPFEFQENVSSVIYPGAGHLIDPPYCPMCRYATKGPFGTHLLWGGEAKPHADAQEDSWKRTLKFLKKHMCPQDQT